MSPTRRTVLRATLPAVVALAGCSGTSDGSVHRGPSGIERNPAVSKPRNLDGEPVLDAADDDERYARNRVLITESAQADRIEFTPGVPEAQAESTRSFLTETDFSAETVYVTEVRVGSCFRYRVHSVSWEPGRIEYDYCRELRPPTDRCETDTRESVGLFFRIPAVLGRDITSSGASGRSPCRSDTDWATIDATATGTPDR